MTHLLRIIGPKTDVRAITTETLQGYDDARVKEKGRSGRCVAHVTFQKELGTLSSIWNRWAHPLKLVTGPAPTKGLVYATGRAKPRGIETHCAWIMIRSQPRLKGLPKFAGIRALV
jgi:hypothetical protein